MSVEVLPQSPDSEFDLFELWNRVWRRRWLVIAISAVFAAAGVTYSLLATPMFRAETVIVQVRDNGLGIAESAKPRLFQVFQRFRPDRAPGEGMGLDPHVAGAARAGGLARGPLVGSGGGHHASAAPASTSVPGTFSP